MNDTLGNLDKIFQPSSVAVIGASKEEKKWGNIIVKRLVDGGFRGKIYPVNPKGEEVLGIKTYRNVKDIDGSVDLAVITVQSKFVSNVIQECLEKGVKGFVINTAGFGETGKAGKEAEREMVELVRQKGARIIGPNCMGIYSAKGQVNTNLVPNIKPGTLAVLAQSGNIFILLYEEARRWNLGFSAFVSVGNQADLQFYEYLRYFADDPGTEIILLYIEDIKEGRKFFEVAKEAVTKKPVLVIKAGHSQSGRRAAASHTGSLAGTDAIHEAAFKQAGVIRINRTDELFPVVEALLKSPRPRGDRVVVFTDGGGFSVLAGDAAESLGLNLVELSPETRAKLRALLPPFANVDNNPLDTAADYPYMMANCAEIMLADDKVDAVVFYGLLGGYNFFFWEGYEEEETKTALRIAELSKLYNKPVLIASPYADSNSPCMRAFKEQDIPVYSSIEQALCAMSALTTYSYYRERGSQLSRQIHSVSGRTHAQGIIKKAYQEHRTNLLETEARSILHEYGIEVPRYEVAHSAEEAAKVAGGIGFPIVMKVLSKDIVHKSDIGGVRLNLRNKAEVKKSFEEMMQEIQKRDAKAKIEGILLTPYQLGDTDVIIGLQNESQFGPVIMFGLGGIFVEIIKDVAFRVAPIDKQEALKMIGEIKGFKTLTGIRGQKPKDIDLLAEILVKVGKIGLENLEIESIDLNPIRVLEKGAAVLDARVILKPNS